MYRFCSWLLALSLIALLAPGALLAEEGASGSFGIGVGGVSIEDDNSRVNEYTSQRADDGATVDGTLELNVHDGDTVLELDADISGPRDQEVEANLDFKRMIRGNFEYNVLEHQLDHELLDYMDAAVVRGGMNKTTHAPVALPDGISPDKVPAFVLVDGATNTVIYGSDTGDFSSVADSDDFVVQTGGASVYSEDLTPGKDFSITRREYKADAEFQIPALPNLTFDVGYRHERREGFEQSIGMSKCGSCHVTGEGREVDEETRDVTAGVTGKFGLLTLRYEYTDRVFDNNASDAAMTYDTVSKPGQPFDNKTFDDRMTYDYSDGDLPYDTTPDSDKESHMLKARVDLPSNTVILGSYVNSEVESSKTDEPGIFQLNKSKLTSTYDGYGLKAATRLGKKLKLSAKVRYEEIDSDDVEATFFTITAPTSPNAGITFDGTNTGEFSASREAIATRDVLTAGLDAVYRLARRTTLRLGYEHKSEDREDEHFGETKTDTYKVGLSARPAKGVSTRLSYSFKNIDNPFANPDAALVELTDSTLQAKYGVPGYIVGANSNLYGTDFYDARTADLSNQPDAVHEAKLSTTWAPSTQFSATFTYRLKDEENDLNASTWEQRTHSPGVSMWYAASNALNFTFAYNYFDQRSETAFCQGFYDG